MRYRFCRSRFVEVGEGARARGKPKRDIDGGLCMLASEERKKCACVKKTKKTVVLVGHIDNKEG